MVPTSPAGPLLQEAHDLGAVMPRCLFPLLLAPLLATAPALAGPAWLLLPLVVAAPPALRI